MALKTATSPLPSPPNEAEGCYLSNIDIAGQSDDHLRNVINVFALCFMSYTGWLGYLKKF